MKKGWSLLEMTLVIGIAAAAAGILFPLHSKCVRADRTRMTVLEMEKIYYGVCRLAAGSNPEPSMNDLVNAHLFPSEINEFSWRYNLTYTGNTVTVSTQVPKEEVSPDFPPLINVTNEGTVWLVSFSGVLQRGNRDTADNTWFDSGIRH